MAGLKPTIPWSQATWGAAPLHPVSQSERLDLNQRSPGPQPGAIPGFATLCCSGMTRVGFEPNLASLPFSVEKRGWQPHQKSNGPCLCGRTFSVFRRTGSFWRWAGRRSNPSLLVFSQALNRLSYQPICVRCSRAAQRKSPVSFA